MWSLETRAYGMGLASIANWLFNFALGFFVPPGLKNITWKVFIIFGVLCLGAAVQAFVSYPETACKSLEEIEQMFRPGAPKPWKTKVGQSLLDHHVQEVEQEQRSGSITYTEDKTGVVHSGDAKFSTVHIE